MTDMAGIIEETSMETKSVMNFLRENKHLIYEYANKAKELGEPLSYSGMLRITVEGTTKEGVNLRSRKVKRSVITQYIEEVLNE